MQKIVSMEIVINIALEKYKKARRIAVENFVCSMDSNKNQNFNNLRLDAKSYGWNVHTIRAIEFCIERMY